MDRSSVLRPQHTTNNIQERSKTSKRGCSTMPFLYGIIFLIFIKSRSCHVIRVVQELAEQTCAVNDSVTFDCGANLSDRVTWYYSPTDLPWQTIQLSNGTTGTFVASEPFNYSVVGYRCLRIEAAKEFHSGRYTCQRTSPGRRWIRPINRTTELRVISGEKDDVTVVRSADAVGWGREWDLVRCLIAIFLMALFLIVFYKAMVARKFRRENMQQDDDKSTSGLVADQTDEFQYAID